MSGTSFVVYYGHDSQQIPRLKEFDLAIIESRGWSAEHLAELRSGGTRLIGYISPVAWPDWQGIVKWWWGRKERDEEWKAWWLSLSSWGWRRQFRRMLRDLPSGLDGVFFDNLDRLDQDKASLKPLIKILKELRATWPDAHLIGNRGFAHWPSLRSHMDGILFENLTDKGFSPADRDWVKARLMELQGSQVYALDYATRRVGPIAEELQKTYPKMLYYCAPNEGLQSVNP